MRSKDITAVLLAGGKNSRIQKEKALLKVNNSSLIEQQVALLDTIFENLIIVTKKQSIIERFPQRKIVHDEFEECGPIGGIHVALKNSNTSAIFVFACDMPYLNANIIKRQIELYQQNCADIVIPRHDRGIEPLHAIYKATCFPFYQQNLNKQIYPVRSIFELVNVQYYDVEPTATVHFFNINTHHDWLISVGQD